MNRFAALSLATAGLALGACSGSSGSSGAPPPTTPGAANALVGTWRTPALPVPTWEAAFRDAGGSAKDARGFVGQLGGGSGTTRRIFARITADKWVELEQADDNAPQVGYEATYATSGKIVRITGEAGCHIGYRVDLTGDTMKLHVLYDRPASNPDCGPNDLAPQRTIWETATFQRAS